MKKYLYAAVAIAIAILVGVCAWQGRELTRAKEERTRLLNNQNALLEEIDLYETAEGKSAASVQALQLTCDELRRHYLEKCQEVKDLGLKVSRLQSLSSTSTQTSVIVKTELKDSIVYEVRDNVVYVDSLKHFEWRDPPWVAVAGTIRNGMVDLDVASVDTLVQIVHRVPKRFLFIKYGTKAIRQEVVSKNPHTRIVYSEYIELK